MSKTLNHKILKWKDLERYARGTKSAFTQSCGSDKDTAIRAVILNYMVVGDLLAKTEYKDDILREHFKYLLSWNIVNVAKLYKLIDNFLLNLTRDSEVRQSDWIGFKHRTALLFPSWELLVTPVKECIDSYIVNYDAWNLKISHQFLVGWGRLNLPSLDYETECLVDYLSNESRLTGAYFSPIVVDRLKRIADEWFSLIDFPELWDFHHGPGGVAGMGRSSLREKYDELLTEVPLDALLYDPYSGLTLDRDRTCSIVFVPKSLLTWRTISMESVYTQFYQQGLKTAFAEWFELHPVLRKKIFLRDQTKNRDAAQTGSLFRGNLGTIDLSSASDSVSFDLVEAVLGDTVIWPHLVASRSEFAQLPNGQTIALRKFAPMGSAVCFPVECLLFAMIAEMTVRECGGRGKGYLVYGDDIVADTAICRQLVSNLRECGFLVNEAKSFIDEECAFRESCGGEYFEGFDITPLRIPRNYKHLYGKRLMKSPSTYECYTDLINRYYLQDYRLARSLLLSELLSLPLGFRPLFVSQDEQIGIMSDTPHNCHLRYEPNFALFGITYHHGSVVTDIPRVTMEYPPQCESQYYEGNLSNPDVSNLLRFHEWKRATAWRDRIFEPISPVLDRGAAKLSCVQTTIT